MAVISIEEKPTHAKYLSYLWADYVELVCLFSLDGESSVHDVIDRLLNREKDLKEGDPDEAEMMSESEFIAPVQGFPSMRSDTWESYVKDWFRVLEYRSAAYGDSYPFVINAQEIKLKSDAILKAQNYLYLLLCSSLNFMDSQTSTLFSSSFELFCLKAFAACVPSNSEIRFFGMNGYNEDPDFGKHATLWTKLNKLADLLIERLNDRIKKVDYPDTNRGDDGLDLLAIAQSYDDLPSKLITFAQCTCEKEWKKKQHESRYEEWSSKIHMLNGNSSVLMIPYCFRGADGQWFKSGDIRQTYLLDRYRLLAIAKSDGIDVMGLPSSSEFEGILKFKESVF